MRSVSFVENIKVEVSDSLFSEALLLADVDNDGDNELIVGQVNGELSIFKGSGNKPWLKCTHLGMIACVAVGDLWNQGSNMLVCVTAEGWCHLFNVACQSDEDKLEPISSQHLHTNCRIIIIADVDGDGQMELVSGHADRTVRIHKLGADTHLENGAQSQSAKDTGDSSSSKTRQPLKQFSKDQESETSNKLPSEDEKRRNLKSSGSDTRDRVTDNPGRGTVSDLQLLSIREWTLPSQIGSLVLFDVMTTRHLLASQPGGTYTILLTSDLCQQKLDSSTCESEKFSPTLSSSSLSSLSSSASSIFYQLPTLGGRNQGLQTNLICLYSCASSVNPVHNQSNLALCTPDGNLIFMNGNKLHWSYHVDQGRLNLFSMSKVDITGDGNEEILLCCLDGCTYIIDKQKNVVLFKFGEDVMAFCAGQYAYTPGKNLPCLVFVTFSNYLVAYWNARLLSMVPSNLKVKMKSKDCVH